ncbi:disulfide bond formation protein DsbD [Planococcus kocurii]|uniref:disulfide bond formation protein DsbD n=1 Tax=Planococcus kocurii TaxID=1374 RepID=UPI003CFEB0AE
MNKKAWNLMGWGLLFAIAVSWIGFGYSSWFLLLLPLAHLSFSVRDGSIKKLGKLSSSHWLQLSFALAIAVAVVFGLILLANFLIVDLLHMTGWSKTVIQVVAIILALYPAKFLYARVVHKAFDDVKMEES